MRDFGASGRVNYAARPSPSHNGEVGAKANQIPLLTMANPDGLGIAVVGGNKN
jgi:glutaminase